MSSASQKQETQSDVSSPPAASSPPAEVVEFLDFQGTAETFTTVTALDFREASIALVQLFPESRSHGTNGALLVSCLSQLVRRSMFERGDSVVDTIHDDWPLMCDPSHALPMAVYHPAGGGTSSRLLLSDLRNALSALQPGEEEEEAELGRGGEGGGVSAPFHWGTSGGAYSVRLAQDMDLLVDCSSREQRDDTTTAAAASAVGSSSAVVRAWKNELVSLTGFKFRRGGGAAAGPPKDVSFDADAYIESLRSLKAGDRVHVGGEEDVAVVVNTSVVAAPPRSSSRFCQGDFVTLRAEAAAAAARGGRGGHLDRMMCLWHLVDPHGGFLVREDDAVAKAVLLKRPWAALSDVVVMCRHELTQRLFGSRPRVGHLLLGAAIDRQQQHRQPVPPQRLLRDLRLTPGMGTTGGGYLAMSVAFSQATRPMTWSDQVVLFDLVHTHHKQWQLLQQEREQRPSSLGSRGHQRGVDAAPKSKASSAAARPTHPVSRQSRVTRLKGLLVTTEKRMQDEGVLVAAAAVSRGRKRQGIITEEESLWVGRLWSPVLVRTPHFDHTAAWQHVPQPTAPTAPAATDENVVVLLGPHPLTVAMAWQRLGARRLQLLRLIHASLTDEEMDDESENSKLSAEIRGERRSTVVPTTTTTSPRDPRCCLFISPTTSLMPVEGARSNSSSGSSDGGGGLLLNSSGGDRDWHSPTFVRESDVTGVYYGVLGGWSTTASATDSAARDERAEGEEELAWLLPLPLKNVLFPYEQDWTLLAVRVWWLPQLRRLGEGEDGEAQQQQQQRRIVWRRLTVMLQMNARKKLRSVVDSYVKARRELLLMAVRQSPPRLRLPLTQDINTVLQMLQAQGQPVAVLRPFREALSRARQKLDTLVRDSVWQLKQQQQEGGDLDAMVVAQGPRAAAEVKKRSSNRFAGEITGHRHCLRPVAVEPGDAECTSNVPPRRSRITESVAEEAQPPPDDVDDANSLLLQRVVKELQLEETGMTEDHPLFTLEWALATLHRVSRAVRRASGGAAEWPLLSYDEVSSFRDATTEQTFFMHQAVVSAARRLHAAGLLPSSMSVVGPVLRTIDRMGGGHGGGEAGGFSVHNVGFLAGWVLLAGMLAMAMTGGGGRQQERPRVTEEKVTQVVSAVLDDIVLAHENVTRRRGDLVGAELGVVEHDETDLAEEQGRTRVPAADEEPPNLDIEHDPS